ncbi:MAG: hypothetical protein Q9159_000161 [Coniocarpon cinnabarinum]
MAPSGVISASSGPAKKSKPRKVLLMGKSGAGKSSMRSIVFSNYVARDVRRLGATIDVEHSNIRFMGNLTLNLWDCGGQDSFMESYLTRGAGKREEVFSNVAVLIFVFDIESRDFGADVANYAAVCRALGENSKEAQVFVLLHKMDLVQAHLRGKIFADRSVQVRRQSETFQSTVVFYATSIWDQSLYRAWTAVIHTLVPNAMALETLMQRLARITDARELILYERTTCLTITKVTREDEEGNPLTDRFERLAAILKTHKHSLAKHCRVQTSSAHFAELEIKTGRFMFFACQMTENTNLAVTLPPSEMCFNAAKATVDAVRKKFVELDTAVASNKVRVSQEEFFAGAAKDVMSEKEEDAERERLYRPAG